MTHAYTEDQLATHHRAVRSASATAMMTFRNQRLRDLAVPMGANWLLNEIAEAKGKQGLYTHQSPQILKALREMALVQSVESSRGHRRPRSPAAGEVSCRRKGPAARWRYLGSKGSNS